MRTKLLLSVDIKVHSILKGRIPVLFTHVQQFIFKWNSGSNECQQVIQTNANVPNSRELKRLKKVCSTVEIFIHSKYVGMYIVVIDSSARDRYACILHTVC